MGFSRRDFLTRVGHAGGYSAAFLAMQGLGLMEARGAGAPTIPNASLTGGMPGGVTGNGVKVAVLGGGIAGLVAAYELRSLGYEVTLLEARERPGGRNWTVRGGDTVTLLDGSKQRCSWDGGHYQNFGPARLPSIHATMLGYCSKLGVELQVEVNMSRSSHLQNDKAMGGEPQVLRQVENDTRGHVSELLAKCIHKGALDADLTAEDRDRMLSFLRTYGPLDDAGSYAGSDRAGYKNMTGAGDDAGVLLKPIDMHTLLDADFWQGVMFDEAFDMQATMFQPVGGMDRIPYAFAKSLGDIVQYNAPVLEIRKTSRGVRIGYMQGGAAKQLEADYCICALPLPILRKIPNDLSAPFKKIFAECTYDGAYKIAWESRRFWEQDYNIYGGLEFVNTGCSPIWLPSAGMFTERGIIVSGYGFDESATLGDLTLEQKFIESRRSIERLHPGHGKEVEKPMYVGWSHVQWNEGSWLRSLAADEKGPGTTLTRRTGPARNSAAGRMQHDPAYEQLIQPDGVIFFAGDHCSHIVGWQEGAALSAHYAIHRLTDQVKAARLAGATATVKSS